MVRDRVGEVFARLVDLTLGLGSGGEGDGSSGSSSGGGSGGGSGALGGGPDERVVAAAAEALHEAVSAAASVATAWAPDVAAAARAATLARGYGGARGAGSGSSWEASLPDHRAGSSLHAMLLVTIPRAPCRVNGASNKYTFQPHVLLFFSLSSCLFVRALAWLETTGWKEANALCSLL